MSETQQVGNYGGVAALTIAAAADRSGDAAIEQGTIRLAGAEASIFTVEAGARVLPGGGLIAIGAGAVLALGLIAGAFLFINVEQ